MADQDTLDQISRKLSVLIAFSAIRGDEKVTTAKRVKILTRLGFSNMEIADLLDTTAGTVGVMKSRLKTIKYGKPA